MGRDDGLCVFVPLAACAGIALVNVGACASFSEQKMSDATHYAEAPPSAFPVNKWVSIVWTIDPVAQHLRVSSPDHPEINVDYALTKTDLGTAVVAVRAALCTRRTRRWARTCGSTT